MKEIPDLAEVATSAIFESEAVSAFSSPVNAIDNFIAVIRRFTSGPSEWAIRNRRMCGAFCLDANTLIPCPFILHMRLKLSLSVINNRLHQANWIALPDDAKRRLMHGIALRVPSGPDQRHWAVRIYRSPRTDSVDAIPRTASAAPANGTRPEVSDTSPFDEDALWEELTACVGE
jgi:hypothetical protein